MKKFLPLIILALVILFTPKEIFAGCNFCDRCSQNQSSKIIGQCIRNYNCQWTGGECFCNYLDCFRIQFFDRCECSYCIGGGTTARRSLGQMTSSDCEQRSHSNSSGTQDFCTTCSGGSIVAPSTCNRNCWSTAPCPTPLVCDWQTRTGLNYDVCRNPQCPDEYDCVCPTPTPTFRPTPTLTPTLSPTATPTATPSLTPTPPETNGWYQVQGGDVHAQRIIQSYLPQADSFFYTDTDNLSVGVVSYGPNYGPFISFGIGRISVPDWLVETTYRVIPQRTYEYFYHLLGSPDIDSFVPGKLGDGIYYSNSSVEINQKLEFLTDKTKVIILINGDLVINHNIIVPTGNFLGFIVNGNIKIGGSVEDIQGFYLAGGEFNTGTSAIRLVGEGVFVANDFVFGRDLGEDNSTIAAEEFRLRPDFLLNSFFGLWRAPVYWQEIPG